MLVSVLVNCMTFSVFVSQLGKGGSWEFKRHRGTQLGVGNVGALAPRIAWELGGRVGAKKITWESREPKIAHVGLEPLTFSQRVQRTNPIVYAWCKALPSAEL